RMRVALAAMLQSPQFLYRLTAPTPDEVEGAAVPLAGWVRASRLSYFLWGSTPDEALLAAAEAGALGTVEGVAAQVRRILPDPRTRATVQHFHRQWLGLDALARMEKDHPYPGGVEALRAVLARSVEALVDEAFVQGVDALLSGPSLHVDGDLAALLGLPAPAGDFGPVAAPADQRAGLLTHPAVLAKLAHPDQTSPIHRGIFVRERLLCQTLPPPPADLIIEPPDPDPRATTQQRFAQHTADPACAGCHTLMDPVGFGFENYDELGRFRQTENGLPVDASGELVAPPTPDLAGPFDGAVALAERLAQSPAVKQCVATWWFRYALARGELPVDACARARIEDAFIDSGGDFTALLVALATSGAFTHRAGTPSDPAVGPLAEPEPEPEPGMGQPPRGFLDGVRPGGIAHGWAFDPDAPAQVAAVDLYLDGGPGDGLYLGSFRADQPRPDVTAAFPEAVGDHGFEVTLPEVARDGRPHSLHALALDDRSGEPTALQGSGAVFRAGLNADAAVNPSYDDAHRPEGFVDSVSADGVVSGWALDRDVVPANVEVHVYVDGPALLGGEFAGSTPTGRARPDVNNALGVPGDHGFGVRLPDRFMDGQPHVIYVYAFNGGHPGNAMLAHSPYEFAGGRR
ncbi:MAG: DUF1588 domain-containing protein, partial [Myxococcales bacterium]|nr:DUF1588 domain-containing protein [Myxococcales bacterium]